MKLKIIVVFIFFNTINTFSQEFGKPVDYLNYINKEQELIAKSTWKYTSAVAHSKSARRIDATRKQLIKSIQSSKKKITDIKNGFNGDTEYQTKVVQYLDFCEKSINEEYDKIINMQEVAEQSYDAMEAYLMMRDLVNKKIDEENDKAELAFKEFALKYNITITDQESELSKKIAISGKVFDYHTALYLIFFKTNITDLNLSLAIEKKDLGAIQQNASALLQYAEEGLEKIKTIQPYSNDSSMLTATKKCLEFYKKEAETFVPKIVDFYMFNEKFENARKSMENKSAKYRTKEEIDSYNGMVKQVNKEIENYNKINATNFQEKSTVVNYWNLTGENFISKHVPAN
jgi:hypothetical protein